MRAGREADRILKGRPDKEGILGEVLERSSASSKMPLPPLIPAGPVLLLLLLPIDDVDDAATPSDDILRELHSTSDTKYTITVKSDLTLKSGPIYFSHHVNE